MRETIVDWCFEGGCTFTEAVTEGTETDLDTTELEALYREPCIGMAD
jgi:hypothetical protein